MDWSRLRAPLLRYGVGWGGGTGALAVVASAVAGFPLELLGYVFFFGGLFVTPLVVGVGDEGIETAAAATEAGFGVTDPSEFQPDSTSISAALGVVCWLLGLSATGAVVLAVVA